MSTGSKFAQHLSENDSILSLFLKYIFTEVRLKITFFQRIENIISYVLAFINTVEKSVYYFSFELYWVEWWLSKSHVYPEPQDVTLVGNMVFADVISSEFQDKIILDLG